MIRRTIGIGVTSYKRDDLFSVWYKQVKEYFPDGGYKACVFDGESNRKGVAKSKNECLRELKDCDFIFLFDDDCFPIHPVWYAPFLEAHRRSKQHHFNYIVQKDHWKRTETVGNVSVFNEAMGCCMFMTQQAVETVGGFNEDFGLYGFEHAEYSQRIYRAGLNSMGPYLSLNNIQDYIHSIDCQGILPEHAGLIPDHLKEHGRIKSSVSGEEMEVLLQKNKELFMIETPIYQPL